MSWASTQVQVFVTNVKCKEARDYKKNHYALVIDPAL